MKFRTASVVFVKEFRRVLSNKVQNIDIYLAFTQADYGEDPKYKHAQRMRNRLVQIARIGGTKLKKSRAIKKSAKMALDHAFLGPEYYRRGGDAYVEPSEI